MSNDVFDVQILAEKLSKLNNSQQSIESLSRWCISHQKKARQIVETWDKLFNSCQREQRVSFLYLANDILQNSRRKGSEFVNEFWKVLPAALKQVYDGAGEHGKKTVTRLVDIWEQRKVFGSRGQGLKDELLCKTPAPSNNGKSSNPIKIVKRDAHSIRIKLAIGGLPEKILTAFQPVLDELLNEEAALNICNTAVSHVGKIREAMEGGPPGNQRGSALVNELQEQENILQQCVGQLESFEATRSMLLLQLKEALEDQESRLECIHSQVQVARDQIEQACSLRKRLLSPVVTGPSTTTTISVKESSMPPVQLTSTPPQPPLAQPMVSFAPLKPADDESKKAAVAAVAAKLAASTSSAQMLTSVLSSLVAEEAASANSSLNSSGFNALSFLSPEKRQKLEKPMPVSDASNSDASNMSYFTSLQQQPGSGMPLPPQSASMQPLSQNSQMQSSFGALPPFPPPPPLSPVNNQYAQSAGMMTGAMRFGYGANTLPPSPLPPHVAVGLAIPASQTLQHSQSQQVQQQQQQTPTAGAYYRPPGIEFYGQNHQTPPPVPQQ